MRTATRFGLAAAILFALVMVGILVLIGLVGFSGWLLAAAIVSGVIALATAAVTV